MQGQAIRQCGAWALTNGAVRWRVWAPRARQIELVLINDGRRHVLPMEPEPRGFFCLTRPDIPEGQRYAYRLDGSPERPDPASLWQPEGVHGPSAVVRPGSFAWTDHAWKGLPLDALVFYELHVGTFTPEGTFDAIIPRLDALRELGVTALEIMPVGQFPGTRNWGYDGVLPYAVQDSYGGVRGLQRLINAAHARGLAVFLDVVYNHFGPEGNYLNEFGPYHTDRYHTPWGSAINFDGAGSDPVREFVLDNVRMWIEEFHADGLRLDAVHAIFDSSPRHILRAIQETADAAGRRVGRRVAVIAESDLNDVKLLLPPERGGYGLDGQWSDDFHHAVHTLLTGERHGYYQDYGRAEDLAKVMVEPFLVAGVYSPSRDRTHGAPSLGLPGDRFVVGVQNHDQVGNRARGDRFGTLLPPPAQRLAACLMLLSPHLPLLFMGEEYGEENPFPFFCSFGDPELVQAVRAGRRREFAAFAWQGEVLDPHAESTFAAAKLSWSWPEGTPRAGMRRLYRDLLAARHEWPALRDFRERTAQLVPASGDGFLLELVRGGRAVEPGKTVQIYFNLTDRPQALSGAVSGEVLFASEAERYAGGRRAGGGAGELLPFECMVFGPRGWRKFS